MIGEGVKAPSNNAPGTTVEDILAGGGGPGGSYRDPNPGPDDFFDDEDEERPDKASVITWIVLLVVLMTFGGLLGAYIVIATNNVLEWKPFDLPLPVWVSTITIILSSFVFHAGKLAVDKSNWQASRNCFVTTTVFGGVFIASQLLAWVALWRTGLYLEGNPYAGFFYILTAAHAIHVLGGIVALGVVVLRNWRGTSIYDESEYRRKLVRSVGWYWHFMGGLWIAIVVLLAFWK
ncbi:MAG: cytochrome c oxidase subunit 3 [Acidobacteria bacterium]|nr:cytochrome c oxidase subunit 3 [Acidobacteriota bacterium]